MYVTALGDQVNPSYVDTYRKLMKKYGNSDSGNLINSIKKFLYCVLTSYRFKSHIFKIDFTLLKYTKHLPLLLSLVPNPVEWLVLNYNFICLNYNLWGYKLQILAGNPAPPTLLIVTHWHILRAKPLQLESERNGSLFI
jgi:hypothetical protein